MAYMLFQVLTFDRRGVSGHANHIAIHKAVRYRLYFQDSPSNKYILVNPST